MVRQGHNGIHSVFYLRCMLGREPERSVSQGSFLYRAVQLYKLYLPEPDGVRDVHVHSSRGEDAFQEKPGEKTSGLFADRHLRPVYNDSLYKSSVILDQ